MSHEPAQSASDTVRLRPVTPADLPELFCFQSDPDGARMAAVIPRDSQTFFSHWERALADSSIVARAITLDSVLVGQISCFSMDGLDSVGYWIARDYWSRGIATRALALFLREVRKRPLHARAAMGPPQHVLQGRRQGLGCAGLAGRVRWHGLVGTTAHHF